MACFYSAPLAWNPTGVDIFVALCVWPSLRPHPAVMRLATRLPDPEPVLPGTSLLSVLIALALFNMIFAIQNGLDIAFLWSGGALPVPIRWGPPCGMKGAG